MLLVYTINFHAYENFSTTVWKIDKKNINQVIELFNKARSKEKIRNITIDETYYNQLNDEEKILYIINQERIDRGISGLRGISKNLSSISISYTTKLMSAVSIGHRAYNGNAWNRIYSDQKISTCHERIEYAENISWFRSHKGYEPYYILRSVFSWMYDDAKQGWRHRDFLLYNDFTFNGEETEGLIGLGVGHGKYKKFNYNTIVTLNLFDPCDKWKHIKGNFYE